MEMILSCFVEEIGIEEDMEMILSCFLIFFLLSYMAQ